MIVAGEYSDEGFSGKNIQGRQDFQRMLNDIQDGKDDVSYVLIFKLSRFGRNAADVLNSLQLMQDFGVNLICVEDGIDSSKDAGELIISVLSAVAEIERENIRTQTMAGREQKAREGKWNGGFAPYGYKLDNSELVIAKDEAEVIRVIYDRYIHTNEGIAGVAKYLNRNGYTKKLRQNNTIPGFSRDFVKNVLYNPVYLGKIAYGRRRTEKKQGTRNDMHVVEQSEFPVYGFSFCGGRGNPPEICKPYSFVPTGAGVERPGYSIQSYDHGKLDDPLRRGLAGSGLGSNAERTVAAGSAARR